MKKLYLILFAISLVLSGCKSDKAYKIEYAEVLKEISSVMNDASYYRDQVTSVWSTAIHDHKYNKYGKTKYTSDFNDALGWYFEDRSSDSQFKAYVREADELTSKVKKLQDAPSSMKDAYDELIDLVSMVNEFNKNVVSPEGSLQNYSNSTYQLYQQISQCINKLDLKYGDVKE